MSSELEELRRTVRDFCDREIRPTARARDRDEVYPEELIPGLAELGILGATLPEEHGGAGLDVSAYRIIIEELGAADSSIRSLVSVNLGLVGGSIVRWGTAEQHERWLPTLAAGGLGAFGLTEPGAGSNPSELSSRAVADGDDWVIDGTKIFISNGTLGAVTMIFARAVVDGEDRGITCFLVPQDAEGYEGSQIHGKLGLRSGDTAEIVLDGVRVGPDAVLGEVGGGMKVALSALDDGRFSLASGAVGLAREALEVSVRYASEREQFGVPIASKQLVQELLAAMHVDVQAAAGWPRSTSAPRSAARTATPCW